MFQKKFDEKDSKWIRIYKNVNLLIGIVIFVLSFVFGCVDTGSGFIDIIYGDNFFDFLIWFVAGAIISITHISLTMLLANIATNLQIIREK